MGQPIGGRRAGAVIMPVLRALLVALAAVGVLFVVMRNRQGDTVWRAYAAEMRLALRTVATAEAGVRDRTGSYTADLALLGDGVRDASAAVSIVIERADSASWRATARHDLMTGTCWIEGRRAGGRNETTRLGCSTSGKPTALRDSVRAGVAPRRGFEQWMRER